ncbi:hypothetical protein ACFSCV_01410 [Methylopila henanensis]|uniref:Uncharacterized protein n=1 Tax=Methylopila henanensis TaxID=873516 RepID=A0ABW4K4P5_9HYPH
MIRWPTWRGLRWLALLLLPLPAMIGYAESRDPIATMTKISNSAAKGDRLPMAAEADGAQTFCAPDPRGRAGSVCAGRR